MKVINLDNISDAARRLFVVNVQALTDQALAQYVGHPSNPAFVALLQERQRRGIGENWTA